MPRPLCAIASDIRKEWKTVSPHAEPYLRAMHSLRRITDPYYMDSGRSVVLYFLSNASGFRGEKAKELKQELKDML